MLTSVQIRPALRRLAVTLALAISLAACAAGPLQPGTGAGDVQAMDVRAPETPTADFFFRLAHRRHAETGDACILLDEGERCPLCRP